MRTSAEAEPTEQRRRPTSLDVQKVLVVAAALVLTLFVSLAVLAWLERIA